MQRHWPRRSSFHLRHPGLPYQPFTFPVQNLLCRPERSSFPGTPHASDHTSPQPSVGRRPNQIAISNQILPPHDGIPIANRRSRTHSMRLPFKPHTRRLPLLAVQQQSVLLAHHLPRMQTHPDIEHPPRTQLPPSFPPPKLDRSLVATIQPIQATRLLRLPGHLS